MPHLQEIGNGDELATVPETDRWFKSEEINSGGCCGKKPADYQFTTDLLKMSSHSSVTISLTNPLSTDEKSREAG